MVELGASKVGHVAPFAAQVTIWRTLRRLGYEWVMRMDDDSFFLSDVGYNIFADMRMTHS